jgi:hypothetical protein
MDGEDPIEVVRFRQPQPDARRPEPPDRSWIWFAVLLLLQLAALVVLGHFGMPSLQDVSPAAISP